MKKTLISMLLTIIIFLSAFSFGMAASYHGKIWTGKPNKLFGYYCTAAQNLSDGDVNTHWAKAKTWTAPGSSPVYAYAKGNDRAVAKTGRTKPHKGWGSYGEPGWSNEGSFKSSAWND